MYRRNWQPPFRRSPFMSGKYAQCLFMNFGSDLSLSSLIISHILQGDPKLWKEDPSALVKYIAAKNGRPWQSGNNFITHPIISSILTACICRSFKSSRAVLEVKMEIWTFCPLQSGAEETAKEEGGARRVKKSVKYGEKFLCPRTMEFCVTRNLLFMASYLRSTKWTGCTTSPFTQ